MARASNLSSLKKEVHLLRSFVIGIAGKDPEGEYRPEFVERVLRSLEEAPRYEFTNGASFLARLQRNA
jgi:hypothetical protein